MKKGNKKKLVRLLEFLIIGLAMGMTEDLLAVKLVSDQPINFHVIFIVFLVALPFAFISEFVVDHPKFWKTIFKNRK